MLLMIDNKEKLIGNLDPCRGRLRILLADRYPGAA